MGCSRRRWLVSASFVKANPHFTRYESFAARAALSIGRNQAAFWKIAYFGTAALLFVVAAWNRFRLPQDPFADFDAYLWPAIVKLSGGPLPHLQGLNFLYPGMVYLILRIAGDFRVISVIQHLLGLAAGAFFLASWSKLADFFPRPVLSRVLHQAIGLFAVAIYLLSIVPVWFERRVRSDAVCMFFEALIFWLMIELFYYRTISLNVRKAVIFAIGAAVSAFVLVSLKPSFTLMALFSGAAVVWLIATIKHNVRAKLAFFGVVLPAVLVLTFAEHHFRRNDPTVKIFLPETLFVFHAKIIHAQMVADLKNGQTDGYSSEWLRVACDDLGREIQRTHDFYPHDFPILGFQADHVQHGHDSLLNRWHHQLGDESFVRFLTYWYWHSLAKAPMLFAAKVAGQVRVFYSTDCPAFRAWKKWPLSSWSYAKNLSVLSQPQWSKLLSRIPAGIAFLERTETLRSRNIVVHQNKAVRLLLVCCARTYLVILLISVPLAIWSLLKPNGSDEAKWPGWWVIFFYSATFGNVLGVSVVHSMEVPRYSTVLFFSALFAHFWAIRWLIELGLAKVRRIKL